MIKSIRSLADSLEEKLPLMIKSTAKESKNPYYGYPDFKDPRLEKWHQYGILTHTKKVRENFYNISSILENTGLEKYLKIFDEKISGISFNDLFDISILLHDLGKISLYGSEKENRQHELESANLITLPPISLELTSIPKKCIDKIFRYISLHAVLGKEGRDFLVPNQGYSLDSIKTSTKTLCKSLANKYNDAKIELGIFFLCDSLGKVDSNLYDSSEEQIEHNLKKNNLSPKLKYALLQLPLNKQLAFTYLGFLE